MFRNLLRPDNPLMITLNQITDVIFLSMFWLICCFPLVTAGAATAALYDSVYRTFRKGEKHSWQRYIQTFRSSLKGSLLTTVIFLAILWALAAGGIQFWNHAVYGNISWGIFAAAAFVIFVLVGILSILFPMYSRFDNPAAALWGNTFRLGLGGLIFGFPMPILFAIMLNELTNQRMKKLIQTVSYAPYFISTVVMCSMIMLFLSPDSGLLRPAKSLIVHAKRKALSIPRIVISP